MSLSDPGWVESTSRTIEADPEFSLDARQAVFNFLLEAGDHRYVVGVDRGHIAVTANPTAADSWDFAVRGTEDAWRRYIDKDPDAEYRDVFGMWLQGPMSVTGEIRTHVVFEGDYRKLFANLQPLYVYLSKLQTN
ncbi:hypothetical protein W59_02476 [Rhodococcus opacus RKJ300 = JCM 13270]|uniref:SCP2 domain-containing protein n=2 Tax=Nocardiaceae TaxID=85025 RepID=I0WYW8_RHOOP|nr:hypothetical protein W59_02476 [Rhodococcus opacus RKJ300 = JCM 13270]QQZ19715.1 hypothetical protein GO592_42200 [Rhodococcus sp. 21391]